MDDSELEILMDAASRTAEIAKSANTYMRLRSVLRADSWPAGKDEFKEGFARYYGLHYAGLTDRWRDAYFDLLFSFRERMPDDPHSFALKELYKIETRRKTPALQCSFVSKLVSIHDEHWPLFDRYVQSYFGVGPPSLTHLDFRISGFVRNLVEIRIRYDAWSDDGRFVAIRDDLKVKIPALAECHAVRIGDFLVRSVGQTQKRRRVAATF
jgi:hypothetical protein